MCLQLCHFSTSSAALGQFFDHSHFGIKIGFRSAAGSELKLVPSEEISGKARHIWARWYDKREMGAHREGKAEEVGESEACCTKEPEQCHDGRHALAAELGQVEAEEAHYDACATGHHR